MRASLTGRRGPPGAWAVLSVAVLTACSSGLTPDTLFPSSRAVDTPTVAAVQEQAENGETIRIDIRVGERTVVGTLNGSAASRDLLAQLPLTLNMSDHGSVEKTGPLPTALSTDGSPASADANPGDIGYYAPGNDFVLYYGNQNEFPGIVVLGSMDGTGSETIGSLDGDITVTVARSQ